jgi:hypothetical protein
VDRLRLRLNQKWKISKGDTATLPYRLEDVLQTIPTVVKEIGWKLEPAEPAGGHFNVRIGANMFTWGQTMVIDTLKIDDHTSKLQITSESVGQVTDYGKNRRDIKKLIKELQVYLRSTRSPDGSDSSPA